MSARPPLATPWVAGIALALLVLLLLTAGGYGYHRDELYFIEAGANPAWGYDDQPPLTPMLGAAATTLFGQTPTALRVPSALALVACVLLAALIARELGGGRRAQVLAAASLAASGAMFLGHLSSTATFDFLAWTVLLYIALLILRRGDRRLWVAFGPVLGLALLNKWLVLTLVVALGIGLVASGRRELLWSPWVLAGAAVAVLLWLPNLAWQADHGWPQQELAGQIADENPVGARVIFLPFQLVIVSPLLAPVWIAGLVWLLRNPAARPFRAIGLGYLALVAICLVTGAKEYYAIGWYPALLGAGGVALERWLERRWRRVAATAAVAASALIAAVVSLPVLPEDSLGGSPVEVVNDDALETVAWPRFADRVAEVWRGLPARDRERAVIFTANYGEAGALRRYGGERGLPRAYSGHNSFHSFGRPPDGARPVIAIGFEDPGYLPRFFAGCRVAARYDNGLDLDNEEQGAPISVCRGPLRPWSEVWPDLHHLHA